MQNDNSLYSLFLSGDTSAYDALMIRHGDSLTFYLNGYLHSWQDAEDLMIEAFARIMVKKPRIREGGLKAYLLLRSSFLHFSCCVFQQMQRRRSVQKERSRQKENESAQFTCRRLTALVKNAGSQ